MHEGVRRWRALRAARQQGTTTRQLHLLQRCVRAPPSSHTAYDACWHPPHPGPTPCPSPAARAPLAARPHTHRFCRLFAPFPAAPIFPPSESLWLPVPPVSDGPGAPADTPRTYSGRWLQNEGCVVGLVAPHRPFPMAQVSPPARAHTHTGPLAMATGSQHTPHVTICNAHRSPAHPKVATSSGHRLPAGQPAGPAGPAGSGSICSSCNLLSHA